MKTIDNYFKTDPIYKAIFLLVYLQLAVLVNIETSLIFIVMEYLVTRKDEIKASIISVYSVPIAYAKEKSMFK